MPPPDPKLESQWLALIRRQWATPERLQSSSLDIRQGEDLCAVLQRQGLLNPEQAAQIRIDARQQPLLQDPRRRIAVELGKELKKTPLFAPHASALFEPRGVLGIGGMGQVVKVFDRRLQREAALKTLKPDADKDDVHRFLREARITAALAHPNIPAIHEAGISPDGEHYILMQLVSGDTLARRLESLAGARPTLDQQRELVEVIARAAEAVAYGHSMGYVHRDLSPANIMIGEFGEVLVMDWGLARELKDERDDPNLASAGFQSKVKSDSGAETAAGIILGTPGYMSPEQARGAAVDVESDIYALGLLLTQVLTNRPAITGYDAHELISRSARGEAATPRMLDRSIPADIDAVVSRALEPDPRRRLPSVASLVENLRAWLAGAELPLYRYTTIQRLERSLKGRRAIVFSIPLLIAPLIFLGLTLLNSANQLAAARANLIERDLELAQTRRRITSVEGELAWSALEQRVIHSPRSVQRVEILALDPNSNSLAQKNQRVRLLAGIGDFPSAEALISDGTVESCCARIWLGSADDPRRLLEDGPASQDLERMASSARYQSLWQLFLACRESRWPDAARLLESARLHSDRGYWEDRLLNLLESLIASSIPNNSELTTRCLRLLDQDPLDLCHSMMAAELLLDQRRPIEALRILAELVFRLPQSARPKTVLASLLIEWNQAPLAIAELDAVIASKPNEVTARLTKAMALIRLSRTSEAITELQFAIDRAPQRHDAHHLLAQARFAATELEASLQSYERAIRLALADSSERQAASYVYERASIRQGMGASLDSIIDDLGLALLYDPALHRARMTRARLLARSGQLDRAMADLDLLRNAPELPSDLKIEVAALLAELGLAEPALALALAITHLEPQSERAWTILGNIQFNSRLFNEAADSYARAMKLRPQNGDTYYNLGVTLEAMKRFEEALGLLDQGLRAKGPTGRIQLARARCLVQLDRKPEAILALEIAALDPDPKISREARRFSQSLAKN